MTVPHPNDAWRKARRSNDEGACVEVNPRAVRDSKNQAGPALIVDLGLLLAAVKGGRLDR